MSYGDTLGLVGDPTRRQILELLRHRPRSVGELAGEMPVSRPAVSRHLRLMKEGGLVVDHAEGTKRIYAIRPAGFRDIVEYWSRFWDEPLRRFKDHAEGGDT